MKISSYLESKTLDAIIKIGNSMYKNKNKLEKILTGMGIIGLTGLMFIPISLKVKNQEPVIRVNPGNGYLYACYDFEKDGYLDRVDAHFKLGDHTLPYHMFEVQKGTKTFEYLQKEYESK